MSKKIFLFLLATLVLSAVPLAEAQQPGKVPRIGWLSFTYGASPRTDAFSQGLRELGYVEEKNIILEHRSAEGREDRLPSLASELVRLKVDIIVALEPPAAYAAKNATRTIPIVIRSSGDPVEEGFVTSIARPGGNITGLYSIAEELTGKRLELLKEVIPRVARVAVLWNPGLSVSGHWMKEAEVAARSLRVTLHPLEVREPKDFQGAFRSALKERAGALITLRNPLIVSERKMIADLALKNRLPAIYDDREFVEVGGLMSYGTNLADLYRRAATYVDKILKGAKPADLPVEQPMKFELVINLKTAKQIGVTIPPNVLARADKVIK